MIDRFSRIRRPLFRRFYEALIISHMFLWCLRNRIGVPAVFVVIALTFSSFRCVFFGVPRMRMFSVRCGSCCVLATFAALFVVSRSRGLGLFHGVFFGVPVISAALSLVSRPFPLRFHWCPGHFRCAFICVPVISAAFSLVSRSFPLRFHWCPGHFRCAFIGVPAISAAFSLVSRSFPLRFHWCPNHFR